MQIAGFLPLPQHLGFYFPDGCMHGCKQIRMFGLRGQFMMTPSHDHFRLIRVVFMPQNHARFGLSFRSVQQLSDIGEFRLQLRGLRRGEPQVTSSVGNFHLILLPNPALMSRRNLQIFAVFRHRPARHLNTLRLKFRGDLIVGERTLGVLIFDHFLHHAL